MHVLASPVDFCLEVNRLWWLDTFFIWLKHHFSQIPSKISLRRQLFLSSFSPYILMKWQTSILQKSPMWWAWFAKSGPQVSAHILVRLHPCPHSLMLWASVDSTEGPIWSSVLKIRFGNVLWRWRWLTGCRCPLFVSFISLPVPFLFPLSVRSRKR